MARTVLQPLTRSSRSGGKGADDVHRSANEFLTARVVATGLALPSLAKGRRASACDGGERQRDEAAMRKAASR
jgi:hypothetical protein